MKRILCFVLTLAMLCSITLPVLSLQAATSEAPAMSVEKTAFATGETIKVKLDCLPDTLPAKTYVILYPRSYVVGGTPNGTWVKITDDDGTHLYNEGDTIDVVKKDALTGTDFSLILVAPYASGQPLYQQIDITIGKPAMSVKKTDFAGGETIKVQLDCLPDMLPAKTYVILYPRSYVVGGTPNGTWVKITDDDGTHLYNEGDTIDVVKKDALTGTDFSLILVAPYASGQPLYQQIDITIGKPTLSMEKTEFAVGEDIAVTYNNVAESLLTGKSWVTVAIFKKGEVVGTHASTAEHRVWHTDASKEQSKQPSATISFPDDDNGRNGEHFPLPVGEYYICIRQDNTVLGDIIEFKVVEVPKAAVSMTKTEFAFGEDITVTYENVDESLLEGKTWVTIAIFKKDAVIGQDASLAEHRVWHKDSTKAQSNQASGTLVFPDADNTRDGEHFPLPAGEYYVCVRQDNAAVGELISFTVKAENKPTGDTNLFMFVAITLLAGGAVAILRKQRDLKETR